MPLLGAILTWATPKTISETYSPGCAGPSALCMDIAPSSSLPGATSHNMRLWTTPITPLKAALSARRTRGRGLVLPGIGSVTPVTATTSPTLRVSLPTWATSE